MTNSDISKYRKDLLEEWKECNLMMMFEIHVENIKTGEEDYILVNLSIDEETAEIQYNFNLDFPFETEIDENLDYNLQGLFEAIITDRNFTENYIYLG